MRGLGVAGGDRPERGGARDTGRVLFWGSLLAAASFVARAVDGGAGGAAEMFGQVLGGCLFFGLWFGLASVSRAVRERSVGVRSGPLSRSARDGDVAAEQRPPGGRGDPLRLPGWTRVACAWPLAFALAGLAAGAAGIVEWRIAGAAAVEVFWMLFVVASLAGAFLWIRLVATTLRDRPAAETATDAPEWARDWGWLSMACPPLLAAWALSAPLVGIERGTVVRLGLVTAFKIVLFAAFSFSLYRGGRFLWRRAGEVVGGIRWSRREAE